MLRREESFESHSALREDPQGQLEVCYDRVTVHRSRVHDFEVLGVIGDWQGV